MKGTLTVIAMILAVVSGIGIGADSPGDRPQAPVGAFILLVCAILCGVIAWRI